MQIAIEVPDNFYERVTKDGCMSYKDAEVVANAFYTGKALPRGHGRLIDADAITKDFNTFQESFVINTAALCEHTVVCLAPTVVEADKEGRGAAIRDMEKGAKLAFKELKEFIDGWVKQCEYYEDKKPKDIPRTELNAIVKDAKEYTLKQIRETGTETKGDA